MTRNSLLDLELAPDEAATLRVYPNARQNTTKKWFCITRFARSVIQSHIFAVVELHGVAVAVAATAVQPHAFPLSVFSQPP